MKFRSFIGPMACCLVCVAPFTYPEIAQAVPVSLEYSWEGAFNVFGHTPVPQLNGFDYAISEERVEHGLAGQAFTLTSLSLTADGLSTGDRINFDVEIHLSGSTIGLPSGQYYSTIADPVAGYTRTAASQFLPVVGDVALTGAFNFAVSYDGPTNTPSASPGLSFMKQLPSESFFLNDGLHAQLFFWTADNRNVNLSLQNVRLQILGDAPNGVVGVPEPRAFILLLSGLVGLMVISRYHSLSMSPLK